jgi:hypothetical protein
VCFGAWIALLVGCGQGAGGHATQELGAAPATVQIAESCTLNGLRIEVEVGVIGGFGEETPCTYSARFAQTWRSIYEERWGVVDVKGWTLRIRAPEFVDGQKHSGLTWYDQRVVELTQLHFEMLPHELHHAQLGATSNDHHGWCTDFAPWEMERHIRDERDLLGCGR